MHVKVRLNHPQSSSQKTALNSGSPSACPPSRRRLRSLPFPDETSLTPAQGREALRRAAAVSVRRLQVPSGCEICFCARDWRAPQCDPQSPPHVRGSRGHIWAGYAYVSQGEPNLLSSRTRLSFISLSSPPSSSSPRGSPRRSLYVASRRPPCAAAHLVDHSSAP